MLLDINGTGIGGFGGSVSQAPDIRSIAGLDLTFEVRQQDGRPVLHFPFMSISDLHLGTRYAKAKKLSHMLHHTSCDELAMVGDILDGENMLKKARWNLGPYHRQVIAHALRKAHNGTRVKDIFGNHDEALRGHDAHRSLEGKNIFGIECSNKGVHVDPNGRRFLLTHGDEFDDYIFKTPEQRAFWYTAGDIGYAALYELDCAKDFLAERVLRTEWDWSIAASGKAAVKDIINKRLGVRGEMARTIDLMAEFDGAIYGHSHMAGFEKTPAGKTLMNDGCCTEHVETLVHDAQGNWAIIRWRSKGMEITEENGNQAYVAWKDLGLEAFREPMGLIEDEHTANADRLIRLIYRNWPPLERQLLVKKIHFMQDRMNELNKAGLAVVPLERALEKDRETLRTLPGPIAGKARRIAVPARPAANDFVPDFALESYA